MNEPVIHSFQDALLLVVPAVGLMLFSFFRLDELVSVPRHGHGNRRAMCGVDADGEPILSDPDGRPVPPRRSSPRASENRPAGRAITLYRQAK